MSLLVTRVVEHRTTLCILLVIGGMSAAHANVGIGTSIARAGLDVATTGSSSAILLPRDSTANRPSTPMNGMLRYNTDSAAFEGFINGAWGALGGGGSGGVSGTTNYISKFATASTLGNSLLFDTGTSVGVGTNTPGTMLDVNGGVRAGSNSTVTTCNAANEGVQRYNYSNHAIEWCNGSSWISAQTGGTTTTVPPAGMGGTGYYVLSASTWTGNLGGLSGANSKCRTELSTYNWLNKPGSLDTTKVFASLCDISACNNLIANTTYYFATANDTTAGGASFTVNSSLQAPGDSYQWNAANRFNTAALYWSNRYWDPSQNTLWGTSPDDTASDGGTCNNWSSASSSLQSTEPGTTAATDYTRWGNQTSYCSTPQHLICFVNP